MKLRLLGLLGGLLVVLVLPLGAQTLEATYYGINNGMPGFGTLTGGPFADTGSGEHDFDLFSGFCTDPLQGITNGETIVYTIQDPQTLNEIGTVQRILDGYYNYSNLSPLDAAGAQWAIWEVTQDGATNPSFDNGLVQLGISSMDIANRALDYLNNVSNYQPLPVTYLVSETRQDMIIVPEPDAASLIIATLGLLVLHRRRA